jgi:hypothetical protein
MQPHYASMGWGLARCLSALVRGASHYIRVPGCCKIMGNSEMGSLGIYPVGRHLGSPVVALELQSMEVGYQGLPGRLTPHGRHPY